MKFTTLPLAATIAFGLIVFALGLALAAMSAAVVGPGPAPGPPPGLGEPDAERIHRELERSSVLIHAANPEVNRMRGVRP